MPSPDELWERYQIAEGVRGRHRMSRVDFEGGLRMADSLADRDLAFRKTHEALRERSLALQVENIDLRRQVEAKDQTIARLLDFFESS